jgi:hypothetical protein
MIIVLTNRQEGKSMPDTKKIEVTNTDDAQSTGQRGPTASQSQMAAAVEAAYILEAVRK